MGGTKRFKKRPRTFRGTQFQNMASVEPTQVEEEATPPSVSKLKLSGSSIGFTSGHSTTVLRSRGSKSSPELPNSSSETVRMERPNSANFICS